jgi:ABC-type Fe3+ transport system permease subunit
VPYLLYRGPSPLPVLWGHLVRFLPLALAVLWPVVRMVPPQLRDSMRVEGASPLQELVRLQVPQWRRAWLWTSILIAALTLGEVGTVAVNVEPPGWTTFAHVLFDRMHYPHENDVYALCLLLLGVLALGGIFVTLVRLAVQTEWRTGVPKRVT